jgi:hypothetical protein
MSLCMESLSGRRGCIPSVVPDEKRQLLRHVFLTSKRQLNTLTPLTRLRLHEIKIRFVPEAARPHCTSQHDTCTALPVSCNR